MNPLSAPSVPSPILYSSNLRMMVWLTTGWIFLVLLAGGLVTSTGSGLTVPDWPLSFGQFFPMLEGGAWFEHSHRVIAGIGGLLTGILGLWILKVETRTWVKRLALAAMGGIFLQAVLGGLTVILKLPASVSMAHACLGQSIFGVLIWIAFAVTGDQKPVSHSTMVKSGEWKWGVALLAALYVQLMAGALLRHTGFGLAFHMGWALVVCAAALSAIFRWRHLGDASLKKLSGWMAAVLMIQMGLGGLAYVIRWSFSMDMPFLVAAGLITAHVGGGAGMLGISLWTTIRARQVSC